MPEKVRGLLIDLSGVVYRGDAAIEGSAEALARLRKAGMPHRFLTNTTSRPLRRILERLARFGIEAEADAVFTPAVAARAWLAERQLTPHFLVASALLEDFDPPGRGRPTAVVVGDAGECFTYDALNEAFRLVEAGAELVALAKNRMYIADDGEPAIDAGAFVAALEFASGREAVVLGKPAADFFHLAAADMELEPHEVAMIGDDLEFDVVAAIRAGLGGILVRTGKPPGAGGAGVPPTADCADLREAVATVLGDHGGSGR
ncbi:MAG TPA: TIGR01458 family HAD-type hydrolase [Thermohalobaculum sp.]|nr:TIGR01458 family HAD-type hydrolase [Thermohalobaculum sp.]